MKCTAEQFDEISKNSAYHDVGALPSNGAAYGDRMKCLYIRPFRLPELKLLSKAAQLNELGPLIRAVDNCISHPVEDLTIGDFYYLLLWLRMYSMPKTPYIIEWHCRQLYFTHKETKVPLLYSQENWPTAEVLAKEYDASECNTHNTSIVAHPDVEIISLEDEFVLEKGFDFPRVSILIELNAALMDNELCMLAPSIQWMPGTTWLEKLAYLDANPGRFGEGLEINDKVVHGLSEIVTYHCNKCRVEHTHELKINALSFFQ